MFYVYSKYMKTEKEDIIKICNSTKDAIHHIAKCYKIDRDLNQLGEYYYFIVKR